MTDVVSPEVRSRMMAGIRGKDTKPELTVRRYLHAKGLRFRLHKKDIPGRPDLVLRKWNVAIFVHGCFWHCHSGCKYFRLPATRADFWKSKIESNVERDSRNEEKLIRAGWRVAVVWECSLRDRRTTTLESLFQFISSDLGQKIEL